MSGEVVGTIHATHTTTSTHSILYVEAFDPLDIIAVDFQTGVVTLAQNIDDVTSSTTLTQLCVQFIAFYASYHIRIGAGIYVIVDNNNNAPIFNKTTYNALVLENAAAGTPVLTVSASDADSGDEGRVTFNITAGDDTERFTIGANDGIINVSRILDYELKAFYNLTVIAEDHGKVTQKTTSTLVFVTIVDVNDNSPEFLLPLYVITVSEDESIGTIVLNVTANDVDSVDNVLTYIVTGGKGVSFFQIDSVSGAVSVKNALDYEVQTTYELTVSAFGSGASPLTGNTSVNITISDTNDNTPTFSSQNYSANVDELSPNDTIVSHVSVTDRDSGTNGIIDLSIDLASNPGEIFRISSTGDVKVNVDNLTYKSNEHIYNLIIIAKDRGSPPTSSNATVIIEVYALNQNAPQFVNGSSVILELLESRGKGFEIARIVATDDDDGKAAVVTYSISLDNSSGLFRVNSSTGALFVNGSLDRETADTYRLLVVATDGGSTQPGSIQSNNVTVTIHILDVNDNNPKFTQTSYDDIYISSNSNASLVIITLSAIDADIGSGSDFRFRIVSGNNGSNFDINATTGVLSLIKSNPDPVKYPLTVDVYDVRSLSMNSSVVQVIEVIPQFFGDPYITFAISSINTAVTDAISSGFSFNVNRTVDLLDLLRAVSDDHLPGAKEQDLFETTIRTAVDNATNVVFRGRKPLWAVISVYFSASKLLELRNTFPCPQRPTSGSLSFYRNFNGFGNNRNNPEWGTANEPLERLVEASYDKSYLNAPVGFAQLTGESPTPFSLPKPSPRNVSEQLFKHVNVASPSLSQLGAAFGQFVFNDIVHVPISLSRQSYANSDKCLSSCGYSEPCFPIQVSPYDPVFGNGGSSGAAITCFPYVRSASSCIRTADFLAARQQINYVSAYIDASNVYGADSTASAKLRDSTTKKGLLKFRRSNNGVDLLPYDVNTLLNCKGSRCALVGDVRSNVHISLLLIHTVIVREHNRIARQLHVKNSGVWTDDVIFYETRKIIIALLQHIFVKEYLPALFGGFSELSKYIPSYSVYKNDIKSAAYNSFATAVAKLVKSQQIGEVKRLDSTFSSTVDGPVPFHDTFFNPARVENDFDDLTRGLVATKAVAVDDNIKQQFTDEYSQTNQDHGIDIAAFVIQQGRDHGLADYQSWLSYCASKYSNLTGVISGDIKGLLASIYGSVDDADLFAAAVTEEGDIGPTFKCIIALQITVLREGDRFWYETPGHFTSAQLTEIKKATLSKLISENADSIQRFPVDSFNFSSPAMPATGLEIDFGKWDLSVYCPPILANVTTAVYLYSTTYKVNVSEDVELGVKLVTVQNQKAPAGVSRSTTYSIHSGNDDNRFDINEITGEVTVVALLDREITASYTLVIYGTDAGFGDCVGPINNLTAEVTVIDINDQAPEFISFSHVIDLSQGSDIGHVVTTLSCTDADFDENSEVVYSITDATSDSTFYVEPDTGQIILNKSVDSRRIYLYRLSLLCSDGKYNDSTIVVINIRAVNEHEPIFTNASFVKSLPEDSQVGTTVVTVSATDLDFHEAGEVRYSIISGNENDVFHIDDISGLVELTKSLDFETVKFYSLIVQAKDRGSTPKIGTAYLNITVTDVNDNEPVFTSTVYFATVNERANLGDSVVSVNASDLDSGSNGQFVLRLTSSVTEFEIKETGEIFVNHSLDADEVSSYVFQVDAVDLGIPALTGTARVSIRVISANEHGPQFVMNNYIVDVREDAPFGHFCFQVSASDDDVGNGAQVTYSSSSFTSLFHVDATFGRVILIGNLNRENQSQYLFVVNASDGIYQTSVLATVNVLDVNDNNPKFTKSEYSHSVKEDASPGPIGISATCSDIDEGSNAAVIYNVTSDTFSINSTGYVSLFGSLDASVQVSFVLTLICKDRGDPPRSGTAVLYVTVTEVNLETPQFAQAVYSATVSEDVSISTSVITVTATDGDSGSSGVISYSIVGGNDDNLFIVSRSSGTIFTQSSLDFETKIQHNVVIEAKDNGVPPRSSNTTVVITVTNVNERAPKFSSSVYIASVKENIQPGSSVASINCTDVESGGNVILNITDNVNGTFTIDSSSGNILLGTERTLDLETTPQYTLEVACADTSASPLTATAQVTIVVLGVNEYRPVFDSHRFPFIAISELTKVGTTIYTISATDEDEGIDGEVQYQQVNVVEKFALDSVSGDVILISSVDHDTPPTFYFLKIVAEDKGVPSMTSLQTQLTISIFTENDNDPVFNSGVVTATIEETIAVGSSVTSVTCTDSDADAEIRYQIDGGNTGNVFEIGNLSGNIAIAKALDAETLNQYLLTVICTDDKIVSLARTATASVSIVLLGINEHNPHFVEGSSYNVTLCENVPLDTLVIDLNATDNDTASQFIYSIVSTSCPDQFHVDSVTGRVLLRKPFDCEQTRSCVINAQVSDGNRSASAVISVLCCDKNDNSPSFQPATYSKELNEASPVGTFVVLLTCSDADAGSNGELLFSILPDSNTNDDFAVSPRRGVVFTNNNLDQENSAVYYLTVTCQDSGSPISHLLHMLLSVSLV